MPFKEINVDELIAEKRKNDPEFDQLWQESTNQKTIATMIETERIARDSAVKHYFDVERALKAVNEQNS